MRFFIHFILCEFNNQTNNDFKDIAHMVQGNTEEIMDLSNQIESINQIIQSLEGILMN